MSIDQSIFPRRLSYQTIAGPSWNTLVVQTNSGQEVRVQRWSGARRKYDGAYGIKSYSDLKEVYDFYMSRAGAANGFLFYDYIDQNSTALGLSRELLGYQEVPLDVPPSIPIVMDTDQEIGIGDGSTQLFQIVKQYTDGVDTSVTRTRIIRYPIESTVVIAIDGVSQPSGWTVSPTTGIVTFTTPPAEGAIITAGFEFYTPVRFGESVDDWFQVNMAAFEFGELGGLEMVELVDETETIEQFYYGGSAARILSASYTIGYADGRVLSFTPSLSVDVFLPPVESGEAGGPHFYILNESVTETITIKDINGTELYEMPPLSRVICLIQSTTGGLLNWVIIGP